MYVCERNLQLANVVPSFQLSPLMLQLNWSLSFCFDLMKFLSPFSRIPRMLHYFFCTKQSQIQVERTNFKKKMENLNMKKVDEKECVHMHAYTMYAYVCMDECI